MREAYKDLYEEISYKTRGVSLIQSLMHRSLEKRIGKQMNFNSVLEVGAGYGQHLAYVKHSYAKYVMLDNNLDLSKTTKITKSNHRTVFVVDYVERMPFSIDEFDRVISTCLLHHVDDVEGSLKEIRRVLAPGGRFDLLVPADPGIVFRAARSLQYLYFRPLGISAIKRLIDARDHKNHFWSIREMVRYVFRNDVLMEENYPLYVSSYNLNLWTVFRVTKNED